MRDRSLEGDTLLVLLKPGHRVRWCQFVQDAQGRAHGDAVPPEQHEYLPAGVIVPHSQAPAQARIVASCSLSTFSNGFW